MKKLITFKRNVTYVKCPKCDYEIANTGIKRHIRVCKGYGPINQKVEHVATNPYEQWFLEIIKSKRR